MICFSEKGSGIAKAKDVANIRVKIMQRPVIKFIFIDFIYSPKPLRPARATSA